MVCHPMKVIGLEESKKLRMGGCKGVTSPLYLSKHPQREIRLSRGHIELILASVWVPWGARWVMCHPKRVIGLEEWKQGRSP